MKKITKAHVIATAVMLALFSLFLIPAMGRTGNHSAYATKKKASVVYVCACLKTKSCSCMTEAKMKGPCACGAEGGPPMKAVPSNSAWAKQNRAALAK